MAETRLRPVLLLSIAALCYAVVFTALCVLDAPAVGVAVYFIVPTALVGMAAGPYAGGAGALLTAFLYMAAARIHPRAASEDITTVVVIGRVVALLTAGVLVGWFAARNRRLMERLRIEAERDHLTGVGNFRFYESAVATRINARDPFVLLLCDMDGLKDVNDSHGHSAGDDRLRKLAAALRSLAGPSDDIARIGGDEFCLITGTARCEEAQWLATRVEQQLEREDCHVTFGWACFPGDADRAASLFEIADERLYARKTQRTGTRSRVRVRDAS